MTLGLFLSAEPAKLRHDPHPEAPIQVPFLPLGLGCPSRLPGSGKRLKETHNPPQEKGGLPRITTLPPSPQTGISWPRSSKENSAAAVRTRAWQRLVQTAAGISQSDDSGTRQRHGGVKCPTIMNGDEMHV